MKHFAWDYEESKTRYYHIYPCSNEADLLHEEAICFDIEQTPENDEQVNRIVECLDELVEGLK